MIVMVGVSMSIGHMGAPAWTSWVADLVPGLMPPKHYTDLDF